MSIVTGTVLFVVGDEIFHTWYQVTGDLKSGVRPLVLLHGGPGIPHRYLLGHAELYKQHRMPIVWYDQIGCGASTHLPDKPQSFWKGELFMDELENLIKHLGIADDYALQGHSWGGMLTSLFAATRHPAGAKCIIIACSPAVVARKWDEGGAHRLSQMPRDVQDAIKKHAEDADPTQDPDYQAAVRAYQKRHICRLDPWPEDLMQAYTEHAKDRTVFKAMLGPKTFHVIGNLKDWNITGILPQIAQPTLVINGRYDTTGDAVVAPFFENIPKVKWVHFSESSHTLFMEELERYFQVVGQFLSA